MNHAPITTNFPSFQPWNCWGLCWEIDAGPPLFTVLQPEMPTDGVWTGRWEHYFCFPSLASGFLFVLCALSSNSISLDNEYRLCSWAQNLPIRFKKTKYQEWILQFQWQAYRTWTGTWQSESQGQEHNQMRISYIYNVYHRQTGCPIIYLEAGSIVYSAIVIP